MNTITKKFKNAPTNLKKNFNTILKRNDIKKSEAYQSGLLGGTLPMYDAYMNLKNAIISDSI